VDILLVDDNPLMQQLMERFLGDLGYSVAVAGRADEAIALARASAPALFLLDIHLPDLDGPEALQALRALPGCAKTPAIAMSGMDEGAMRPASVADFVAYLAKPIDLDLLEATVAQHVGDHNARSIG
jgi:two-component system, cell cycle response regulator DivK